jgi:hypothetical protein
MPLFCIVVSLTFKTLLKITGWIFFLLNLVLDSIVQKDVIIRESTVLTMEKKAICKNCGDNIGSDSNSNEFCSEQCGVEYRLEHK